jgi:hypothetical protein
MKLMTLIMGLMCFFTLGSQNAEAKSADAFHKRFQVIRTQDGKLIGIRDRTLPVKFSVKPYVEMVKSQLKNEQAMLAQATLTGDYESEVRSILDEDRDMMLEKGYTQDEYERNVQTVVDSLKELAALNVDKVFSNPAFNDIVSQFEGKMTDAILFLDPTILANVNDSSFFYKRNVTYKAVSWALDFARKKLSNIPILNTVSHIVVQVENRITERRNFHQNMLLHYLENFKEADLGLTHDEVNMIWSSIYESRIPWYAYWESNNAKANWMKYGTNNFFASFRAASAKLRTSGGLYTEVSERMNFAFQKVTYKNEKVVVNLFDNEGKFINRPAVAFNYDRPTQIARKRIMLNLAELGLSFITMPASVKDAAGNFMKSFYVNQKITEGALYGYFESMGETQAMAQVRAQYINPFDTLSLQ